ncbi:MAG: hypothetical protein HUJ25_13800 [Crocinitomicaceae bacterium]|nr:hypothetical protein [Crocinitomicaceae bacterium]
MNKWWLGILILMLGFSGQAQNRKFLIHLNKQDPFKYDEIAAGAERLDLINLNTQQVCGVVLNGVNSQLSKKLREPLVQDSLLNKICYSGVQTYSTSRYTKRKTWKKEEKNINYALKLNHSRHKMFAAYAFKVDLLDLPGRDKFYCDKRNFDSDLHLYAGHRPKIRNPEHEDYVEPVPLFAKTEQQMVETLLELLESNGCMRNIMSRKFTRIGMAVRMEERSLYRTKRPYMYVVMILSGKQNYHTKKKDKLERMVELEKTYE